MAEVENATHAAFFVERITVRNFKGTAQLEPKSAWHGVRSEMGKIGLNRFGNSWSC